MFIKIFLLLAYIVIMIAVGLKQKANANSVSNFVLGGRSISPWMSAFSYGTTYFSGVIFVGNAGQFGFRFGMAGLWIGIGCAVIGTMLPWVVLGRRTRLMSNHLQSITMPDFFNSRFESRALKITASAIIFIFLVPYTASIYSGLSTLFEMAFHVPFWVCVILMAALTGIYVVLGGYMATAITDFIQGIIMLFGIVTVVGAVISQNGGFLTALNNLSQTPSQVPLTSSMQGAYASFFGPDPFNLMMIVILIGFGTWGLPQTVHKFYVIKSSKAIFTGTVVSTLFGFVVAGGCYLLGGFARLYDSPLIYRADGSVAYDSIVPTMISTLGDPMIGLVIVLVLAASMSTLASLVISSSSTLTLDLIGETIAKDMTEKGKLFCIRGLIIAFVLFSVLLTVWRPTFISQLLSISWGALAGSFMGPFFYSLFWKRTTAASVWASFATGVGITVSNLVFGYMSITNAGATAMLVSFAVVPLVSILSKAPDTQLVESIFACYEE